MKRYVSTKRIKKIAKNLPERMEWAKNRKTTLDTAIKKIYELEQKVNKLCDMLESKDSLITKLENNLDLETEFNTILQNKIDYMNVKPSKCVCKYLEYEREECGECFGCANEYNLGCENLFIEENNKVFKAYNVLIKNNILTYIDYKFYEREINANDIVYFSVDGVVLINKGEEAD